MYYQIDSQRLLVLLVLLGAGVLLATLLVRPGPRGSERFERERLARSRRRFALRGMFGMTLLGLCSGLAGGLLESSAGQNALTLVLHGIYRVCWAPAFLMRELQLAFARLGVGWLDGEVPGLLALLLIPVAWFLVFLGVAHWRARRAAR